MQRLIVAVFLAIGLWSVAGREIVGKLMAPVAAPEPAGPVVEHVAEGPYIPHAFGRTTPKDTDHTPAQLLVDADAVIARWKTWKAKPVDPPIPFFDYSSARMNLTRITANDPEFNDGKAKAAELDRFGVELANAEIAYDTKVRALEAQKAALALANDVDGRKRYAQTVEENFLRDGIDAEVTTQGDKATTLRAKYIGFTRPAIFRMQEKDDGRVINGIIDRARERGFRKLILWDGYKFSWEWDLTKR